MFSFLHTLIISLHKTSSDQSHSIYMLLWPFCLSKVCRQSISVLCLTRLRSPPKAIYWVLSARSEAQVIYHRLYEMYHIQWLLLVPFRAFTRHHGEFLRYGNSFPPTFPEDLLGLANCREACKYKFERQYKCGARDNYVRIFFFTLLNLGYGLNYYSSRLRFAHSRAGLMAAPLQGSGEYDIFLKVVRLPSDQRWTFGT